MECKENVLIFLPQNLIKSVTAYGAKDCLIIYFQLDSITGENVGTAHCFIDRFTRTVPVL